MTTQRFLELIQWYKKDRLSEQDWEELFAAFKEGAYDEVLEKDIRAVFDDFAAHGTWDKAREQLVWRKVQEQSGSEEPPGEQVDSPPDAIPVYRRLWLRYTAAAVILLLAGLYYLVPRKQVAGQARESAAVIPIPPGTNKALLTLSDGRQVQLDEQTISGDVATEGKVRIVKMAGSLLAYNTGSDSGGKDAHAEQQEEKGPGVNGRVAYNVVTTPRGGQYQLILPDGTHVWLNAASAIRYPTSFRGKVREVELSGEAYFEVQHNAAQPFRVRTAGQVIEDIGTAFNINAYPDEKLSRATLIEGVISISHSAATGIHDTTSGEKKTVILKPAQQAIWEPQGRPTVADGVDIDEVMAWKNGFISFAHSDFQSVMRQISRWYDVDVHYAGAIPGKRFFGSLKRNVYLSTILEYLQKDSIHIRQEGRVITVEP